ncbi:MAG TPA: hypothetical protein VF742_14305, partial [Terracidiphilus sp.]
MIRRNQLSYFSIARRVSLGTAAAFALVLAGCSTGTGATMQATNSALIVAGGETSIDTNCTGCNATRPGGASVYRLTAMQADGGSAD